MKYFGVLARDKSDGRDESPTFRIKIKEEDQVYSINTQPKKMLTPLESRYKKKTMPTVSPQYLRRIPHLQATGLPSI
jgi:hypothetical protein